MTAIGVKSRVVAVRDDGIPAWGTVESLYGAIRHRNGDITDNRLDNVYVEPRVQVCFDDAVTLSFWLSELVDGTLPPRDRNDATSAYFWRRDKELEAEWLTYEANPDPLKGPFAPVTRIQSSTEN
jgi:hypothetical protein